MRAVPLLLALAALAAWPANAQQAGLRGPVSEPKAEQPALPAPLPLLAPPAAASDAPRCRMNCASAYYACLSTDAVEDCSPNWMQCRSACEASTRHQVITTIPGRP